jgi:hypothetical protein
MLFRLVNAEYDSHTKRAYVEFRANDGGDGDELSKSEIKQEIVRKARHALKRAALAT